MTLATTVGWCPGALRPMETGDGFVLRIKPRGGVLDLRTAAAIARLALDFGNGDLDLTARANLQIRGVAAAAAAPLAAALDALGLLDPDPRAEAVRNVVASPLAGLDGSAACDIRPVVAALERRFVADRRLHDLPAKWSIVVDDGGALSLAGIAADLRFEADRDDGFAVILADAAPVGTCRSDEVAVVAADLAALALQPRPQRMRDAVALHGAETILRRAGLAPYTRHPRNRCPMPGERPPSSRSGEGGPRNAGRVGSQGQASSSSVTQTVDASRPGDRFLGRGSSTPATPPPTLRAVPSPLREQGGCDTCSETMAGLASSGAIQGSDLVGSRRLGGALTAGAAAPFGALHARDLLFLAETAERLGAVDLRLTPWRVLIVTGLAKNAADTLFAALATTRLIGDPADPRLGVAACPGGPACWRGTTPVREHAAQLADLLGTCRSAGIGLHVSGCGKGCAHPHPAAWTLVARDGRYDIVRDGTSRDTPIATGLTFQDAATWLSRSADEGRVC